MGRVLVLDEDGRGSFDFGPVSSPPTSTGHGRGDPSLNPHRCPTYPTVASPPPAEHLLRTTLVTHSGMDLRYGSTGPVVTAVQTALTVSATGGFYGQTQAALDRMAERAPGRCDRVMDPPTWRAMLKAFGSGAPTSGGGVHGFDADGIADVLAVTSTGSLCFYRGNGAGYITGGRMGPAGRCSTRWAPGDFSGDGKADVIGRTPVRGALPLPRQRRRRVHQYPRADRHRLADVRRLFSAGDFTGDGKADVLGRTPIGASSSTAATAPAGSTTAARGWAPAGGCSTPSSRPATSPATGRPT